jgi:PAS domain S-box-containing protein
MPARTTRLESLLQAVPDALVGMDQEGVIRFVNRQTEALFGYDRDQLIGRRIETLVPEPLWQIYAEHRQSYFADPRTRSSGLEVELSGRQRDGSDFPINISLSTIDTGDVLLVITAVRDVAQQKQAVQNAQLLTAIFESSLDAIISGSLEGIITSWNPAAEQMYGYSSKEIIGKPAKLLTPMDREGEIEAVLEQIKAGRHLHHLETKRVRKNGTAFPVSLTVSPIRDADGAIVGTSVIHRDLSEQQVALVSAQRIAAIVESSDDAIIGRTTDGIVTTWNPAAERMFGYTSQEIVGKPVDLIVPQGRAEEMTSILAKIRAGRPVSDFETFRVRKDGTVFPVSLTVSPIRDDDAKVVGASVIAHDMTARRQALAADALSAAIVQGCEDAIITGSLEGLITSWNPAAERIYGYFSAEVIGKPASLLAPHDRAGEINDVLEQIEAGRHDGHLETKRVRKDGSVFPVWLTVSAVRGADGAIVGASVIHRDLSEQRGALAVAQAMSAIVEYSNDAIIGRTLDGIITSWNPAAEKMFGYSGQEIVGKPIDILIPKDRAGEMMSILAKISAGCPVSNFETIRVRKDLTVFPVSMTLSPILDENGAVVSASVIYRDVSEVSRAAHYSRTLIEAALDPWVTISPEGKIIDINEATVQATGVPRSRLVESAFSDYFTDPDKANRLYRLVFARSVAVDYPLTMRHQDGTLTDVLCNASVYRDSGGKVLGVLATARDMTKQVQATREAAGQRGGELERLAELERFQRLAFGRDLTMIELRKEIESLRKSGRATGGESGPSTRM